MNKVFIEKCDNYGNALEPAFRNLMNMAGGMESVVAPGQKVLIKPNLLSDRDPEQCVTTHPELIRHIIRSVRAAGGEPVVADSPAGAVDIEKVWDATGLKKLCLEENVPLLNLEKHGSQKFEKENISFSIAAPVLEADVIINVPKLKTHMLTVLTCSVKNMFGCVPGLQKMMLHRLYPTPREFGRLLSFVYEQIPPTLTICDAVRGMQGNGPAAGEPAHLGFLAASRNGIALDFAMCKILAIPVKTVHYLGFLKNSGLRELDGKNDNSMFEISGAPPENNAISGFKIPGTLCARLIPGRLVKIAARLVWSKPVFTEACIGCGLCARSCPAEAIEMTDANRPVLKKKLCIECCCCHEVCPENAVEMKNSPLLGIARAVRDICRR